MKGYNEYKMKQSFWVPRPCFDPMMGQNMHELLHGANIDKLTSTFGARLKAMSYNLFLVNHYYVATPSKSP